MNSNQSTVQQQQQKSILQEIDIAINASSVKLVTKFDIQALSRVETGSSPWMCISCGNDKKQLENLCKVGGVTEHDFLAAIKVKEGAARGAVPRFRQTPYDGRWMDWLIVDTSTSHIEKLQLSCNWGIFSTPARDLRVAENGKELLIKVNNFRQDRFAQTIDAVRRFDSLLVLTSGDREKAFSKWRQGVNSVMADAQAVLFYNQYRVLSQGGH